MDWGRCQACGDRSLRGDGFCPRCWKALRPEEIDHLRIIHQAPMWPKDVAFGAVDLDNDDPADDVISAWWFELVTTHTALAAAVAKRIRATIAKQRAKAPNSWMRR